MNQATNILTALDDAHLVRFNNTLGICFAWFGGPALNVYTVNDAGLDIIEQLEAGVTEANAEGFIIRHRQPTRVEVLELIENRTQEFHDEQEAAEADADEEPDAECTECGERFWSGDEDAHPDLPICSFCH